MLGRMASSLALLAANLHRLACPVCYAPLALAGEAIDCTGCLRRYPIVDGLPVLIALRATLRGDRTD